MLVPRPLPSLAVIWKKSEVEEVHELDPGPMNNGVFGPWDACPRGSHAVGVRSRFSPNAGNVHVPGKRSMGLASVHLLCEDPPSGGLVWRPIYVSSNEVRAETKGLRFSWLQVRPAVTGLANLRPGGAPSALVLKKKKSFAEKLKLF